MAAAALQIAGKAGETYAQYQSLRSQSQAISAESKDAQTKTREQTQRILAKQRAVSGAAGVDSSSGTPLMVALDTARRGEMEALGIKARADYQKKMIRRQIAWTVLGGFLDSASSGASSSGKTKFGGTK